MHQEKKKVAVVGSGGRLGAAIVRVLEADPGYEVVSFTRRDLDLTQPYQIRTLLGESEFDVLLNAAAYTAVDDCERFPEQAHQINADAVRIMARICAERGVRMIHISTDFVFDGKTDTPYTEEDAPNPLSVYGRSKLAGEEALLEISGDNLVVRLSWIFGPDRPGFPDWLVQNALVNENFAVVSDKIGSPTFSSDCARHLKPLLFGDSAIGGILHLNNSGSPVWIEWGQFCLDEVTAKGIELKTRKLGGITMEDLPVFVAQRPHYSALCTDKFAGLTGASPRCWKEATADYIDRYLVPNITGPTP